MKQLNIVFILIVGIGIQNLYSQPPGGVYDLDKQVSEMVQFRVDLILHSPTPDNDEVFYFPKGTRAYHKSSDPPGFHPEKDSVFRWVVEKVFLTNKTWNWQPASDTFLLINDFRLLDDRHLAVVGQRQDTNKVNYTVDSTPITYSIYDYSTGTPSKPDTILPGPGQYSFDPNGFMQVTDKAGQLYYWDYRGRATSKIIQAPQTNTPVVFSIVYAAADQYAFGKDLAQAPHYTFFHTGGTNIFSQLGQIHDSIAHLWKTMFVMKDNGKYSFFNGQGTTPPGSFNRIIRVGADRIAARRDQDGTWVYLAEGNPDIHKIASDAANLIKEILYLPGSIPHWLVRRQGDLLSVFADSAPEPAKLPLPVTIDPVDRLIPLCCTKDTAWFVEYKPGVVAISIAGINLTNGGLGPYWLNAGFKVGTVRVFPQTITGQKDPKRFLLTIEDAAAVTNQRAFLLSHDKVTIHYSPDPIGFQLMHRPNDYGRLWSARVNALDWRMFDLSTITPSARLSANINYENVRVIDPFYRLPGSDAIFYARYQEANTNHWLLIRYERPNPTHPEPKKETPSTNTKSPHP